MAIYIVDGKIGSGKTYYSVWHILRKHFIFDKEINEYIPRSGVVICTNIEGLKVQHETFDKRVEIDKIKEIFSENYVDHLRDKYKCRSVLYVVDEAQNLFPTKFYDKDVFFFFQYSRHYGVDIYLITQDVDSLVKQIKTLCELVVHATSRTNSAKGVFYYKYISGDEVVGRKVLKADKRIFKVYKSFNFDETEPPRPIWLKYTILIIVAFLVAVLAFKFLFLDVWSGSKNVEASERVTPLNPLKPSIPSKSVESPNPKKIDVYYAPNMGDRKYDVKSTDNINVNRIVTDEQKKLNNTDSCRKTSDYKFDSRHIETFVCNDQLVTYEADKEVYRRNVNRHSIAKHDR
jgi:zona occludens toxin (predicted ATPase)